MFSAGIKSWRLPTLLLPLPASRRQLYFLRRHQQRSFFLRLWQWTGYPLWAVVCQLPFFIARWQCRVEDFIVKMLVWFLKHVWTWSARILIYGATGRERERYCMVWGLALAVVNLSPGNGGASHRPLLCIGQDALPDHLRQCTGTLSLYR